MNRKIFQVWYFTVAIHNGKTTLQNTHPHVSKPHCILYLFLDTTANRRVCVRSTKHITNEFFDVDQKGMAETVCVEEREEERARARCMKSARKIRVAYFRVIATYHVLNIIICRAFCRKRHLQTSKSIFIFFF